ESVGLRETMMTSCFSVPVMVRVPAVRSGVGTASRNRRGVGGLELGGVGGWWIGAAAWCFCFFGGGLEQWVVGLLWSGVIGEGWEGGVYGTVGRVSVISGEACDSGVEGQGRGKFMITTKWRSL